MTGRSAVRRRTCWGLTFMQFSNEADNTDYSYQNDEKCAANSSNQQSHVTAQTQQSFASLSFNSGF